MKTFLVKPFRDREKSAEEFFWPVWIFTHNVGALATCPKIIDFSDKKKAFMYEK